jgi:hypothetical protein
MYKGVDPQTIEQCWIQPDSFPNLIAIAANPTLAPYLNQMILQACAAVNRICQRKFNAQTIDQIFMNQNLLFDQYLPFAIYNLPLIEVEHVWLQVVQNFSEVSLQYMQVLPAEGIVKLLPNFTAYAQTSIPLYQLGTAVNLWIRYRGGFEVDYTDSEDPVNEVPFDVQFATALYVNYLAASYDLQSGVESFKTQTYEQRNVKKLDEDPVLSRVNNMLKPWRLNNVV